MNGAVAVGADDAPAVVGSKLGDGLHDDLAENSLNEVVIPTDAERAVHLHAAAVGAAELILKPGAGEAGVDALHEELAVSQDGSPPAAL